MNFKSIISSLNSWNDFKNVLEGKTKLEKGTAFEELTRYFLEYYPIYKSKLKSVWLQKEVPATVVKKLNLPLNDQGIDLIAETFEGDYWAIQCKYLQDEDQKLSHRKISTFISLSKQTIHKKGISVAAGRCTLHIHRWLLRPVWRSEREKIQVQTLPGITHIHPG